ncbi:3-isopropylmalate dehydratase large subunit [Trifolium pratense]|uniref:3-isopropylmalate dehydratase large subunit n=2 Tax=Trifolium pratense TaxID=57577 RepID=A0A2K3JWI2_TRIPR|nr:3-isopropylmalate dehydratase large subunit [Trifolium pratense]
MFIPMNDQGSHWYLMVVDFNQRKLVWLDSLHCASRDHFRRRAILRMAIFIEEILMHESYGQLLPGFNQDRLVSTFSLYQPRHIQQQRPGSNDCGVWVSKWMIECPLRSEYGYVTVNTATRMKLAIHLVKAANNELYDEVLAKAAESWRAEEERRKNLVKI